MKRTRASSIKLFVDKGTQWVSQERRLARLPRLIMPRGHSSLIRICTPLQTPPRVQQGLFALFRGLSKACHLCQTVGMFVVEIIQIHCMS